MAKVVEIRALARDDDRSDFSCGQPDLDRFFEHYAGQNQFKLHLAVTYVAVAGDRDDMMLRFLRSVWIGTVAP